MSRRLLTTLAKLPHHAASRARTRVRSLRLLRFGRRHYEHSRTFAALGMTLLWALYLRHRLGGQSGDVLGAGAMLVEAAALLVWIAR